ncbi:TMAO reductase system periplasmic protein TorT [Shewanella sp. JM162201]|uniref:TMAO reductase system periplasmic protein TorT n=1 Tax=Shewanella jiangmenensis TaxID=2837387 RepID=A0ABS5V310_9GAMM|nr:TMAO reductase system periplasmic protein TorT [Shewanella jiangmenensis]MBT1443458.1 TMAO reductase system periplasmic protein TorT [Shewanella jiangmenensis]
MNISPKIALLLIAIGFSTAQAETWQLEQRSPFNALVQEVEPLSLTPLSKTEQAWKLCVLVPHLKDAYWIGINYGLSVQAKALGVSFDMFEAGGYDHKARQLAQLGECLKEDYDAVLLGAVSPDLLQSLPHDFSKPVLALVNKLDDPRVTTHIGVNWFEMGSRIAGAIKARFGSNGANAGPSATVALLAGPESAGGTELVEQGIKESLQGSKLSIGAIRHADNNRHLQREQLLQVLESAMPDAIIGSAVAIEVAVNQFGQTPPSKPVVLGSSYFSPAIARALQRGKIAAASDDKVVLQGRLAVDLAVRTLQGDKDFGDIGPAIVIRTANNSAASQLNESLPPAEFYPVYSQSSAAESKSSAADGKNQAAKP